MVPLCLLALLAGCGSSVPADFTARAQAALSLIEAAEDIYFTAAGADPTLQADAAAANQAAATAIASAGTQQAVTADIQAAFAALGAIDAAYAKLAPADAARAAMFAQYLSLAQAAVTAALQLAAGT
jgi:hypothetical protein